MLKSWFVAVAALVLASCSSGGDVPTAERTAAQFRKMLAAGQYAEIYRTAAEDMRTTTAEADLTGLLEQVNNNLGKFESAPAPAFKQQSANGGDYVTLEYDSKYERGTAQEKIIIRFDDGKAALAGYEIDADFNNAASGTGSNSVDSNASDQPPSS